MSLLHAAAVEALIRTHQYERASTFAKEQLRQRPSDLSLRHGLTALLLRLRRWQEAIDTASACESESVGQDNPSSLCSKLPTLLLKVKALLAQAASQSLRDEETEIEERLAARGRRVPLGARSGMTVAGPSSEQAAEACSGAHISAFRHVPYSD